MIKRLFHPIRRYLVRRSLTPSERVVFDIACKVHGKRVVGETVSRHPTGSVLTLKFAGKGAAIITLGQFAKMYEKGISADQIHATLQPKPAAKQ